MTLLRLWLGASGLLLAGLLVWAFAPVMLFALLLTGGLGVIAGLMICLARWVEARLEWRRNKD
jgi:hypothetical protein